MDETQKRKVSAKVFLLENRKIGFIVATIFTSLIVIYFTFIFFYSRAGTTTETEGNNVVALETATFMDRLFPTFGESDLTTVEYDENGLPIIKTGTSTQVGGPIGEGEEGSGSKLYKIDSEPVLAYTILDKSVSIKNFIKNKPKICDQKLEPILVKDDKSPAVSIFQKTLKSMESFENTPDTGVLDEATREQLYIFQKRYSEILYKNKKVAGGDKEPTRLIDQETAHFLNLLCNFEKELPGDYVLIPTLRYIKKETRQIVDYSILTKEKTALETRTATGTEEAILSPNGDYTIFRKEVAGEIVSELVSNKNKNRVNLEKNAQSPDFNNENLLVYGVKNNNGMIIKVYNADKNEIKRLAEIPLTQWSVFWQSKSLIGIYNKPSNLAEGIFMVLDITNGKLKQVTTPQNGLSARATGVDNFTIVSTAKAGNIKTLLVNNQTKSVGDLGIQTFAEKCSKNVMFDGVFCAVPRSINLNATLPDDWYKGKIRTEDIIMYKSIAGTSTKIISQLENKPLSVIDLQVNKNGIFFIDENTLNLYSIES